MVVQMTIIYRHLDERYQSVPFCREGGRWLGGAPRGRCPVGIVVRTCVPPMLESLVISDNVTGALQSFGRPP